MDRARTRRDGAPFYPLEQPDEEREQLPGGTELELPEQWVRVRYQGGEGMVPLGSLVPFEPAPAPAPHQPEAAGPIREYPRSERLYGHQDEPVRAHSDFHRSLRWIEQFAEDCDVHVVVTHSFRRREVDLSDAIVAPAKRSNHLVGHAIDMNLIVNGQWLNSKKLARANHPNLPLQARCFIGMLRDHATLRWGGDFVHQDPVHIDDNLSRRDPRAWEDKLRSLSRGIA
jgi:hypothetical protein